MDFSFDAQVPKSDGSIGGNNNSQSNVDFDALLEYQLEKLGGVGKHDYIGVISRLDELGVQEQDKQTVVWDDKAKSEHAWRFETGDDGKVKDPTAKIEQAKYSGRMQECLIYSRKPVAQVAISVDFPEIMLDVGKFYSGNEGTEKPYREIIGLNGFVPAFKQGKGQVIAKPFNLNHMNVNQQKKDAKPHWAFAKNGKIHEMAEWAGVLDEEGCFHIKELGKLIGKPMNFSVEVSVDEWQSNGKTNRKLVVDVKPVSKLSVRDRKAYDEELADKVTEDLFGVLLFKGGNTEKSLKEVRKATVNTMKLSSNWETSKLKEELESVNPVVVGVQSQQPVEQKSTPQEDKPIQEKVITPKPEYNEPPMDFDDDMPF